MDDTKLKNLDELYQAIDMGLDIVFYLYGTMYNISWRDYHPFICTCPDGDAVFYDNATALIKGERLDKNWKDIVIESM